MYSKDTKKRYTALFKLAFEKLAAKFGVVPRTARPGEKGKTP
jgi:hypothetical protein